MLRLRTDRGGGRDSEVRRHLEAAGVTLLSMRRGCAGDELTFEIKTTGMDRDHDELVDRLLADAAVREIKW